MRGCKQVTLLVLLGAVVFVFWSLFQLLQARYRDSGRGTADTGADSDWYAHPHSERYSDRDSDPAHPYVYTCPHGNGDPVPQPHPGTTANRAY